MKKITLVFAALAIILLTMSACGGSQECPAYSDNQTTTEVSDLA